jgi:hypothetical protein
MNRLHKKTTFLILQLFIGTVLFAQDEEIVKKTPLAGKTVFNSEAHLEWLQAQQDPDLDAEEKIKKTVDTYFKLKYKSKTDVKLYDFKFLFDINNERSFEDYAYERGLLYSSVITKKHSGTFYISYVIKPKYTEIKVKEKKAEVSMWVRAQVVFNDIPGKTHDGSEAHHYFSLVLRNGQWLIQRVICRDEMHQAIPRGTDFNEKVDAWIERWKKEQKRRKKKK